MKTKKRNYIFLAVLMMGIAMMMTACADNDLASQTPIGGKIVGKWYAETPKQVTLGTGKNAVECAKVVLVGSFDEGGDGFWSLILVDKQNRAIQPVGKDGEEHPYWADCNYSVTGNTVNMELTANYLPTSQREWTFNYNGTCLQTKYEDRIIDLHPITTGEDAMYQEWMQQLGFGAEMVDFNINDKDITAENWRQTEGIYIYDGVGADVTDEKGRTGYTLVALPWYNGTKQTNLPEGFCDDITPEMGWEWVANYCGNRSVVSNNFFAVYNKYTGILRFFYYMPQGTNTGNDHVWQVSMTDNLATHTTIPYGVPNDRTITNKAAITQDASGTFMDYVTPWVDYRSDDGLIVPNDGWWAFDVDLSLTRPEALAEDNNIKLQMRSWNTSHTSLYSAMSANIDGTMKGTFEGRTPLQVSSSKGFFGKVGEFIKIGSQVKDVFAAYKEGNYAGAIKGGIGLAKSGINLASGKPKTTGGDPMIDGSFEGTLNMMMQGTINTEGVISGSQPTVGIASPTLYLKDFDTKNSHLGQGVWNLKKTPVVYVTESWNTVHDFIEEKYRFNGESKEWLIDAATWTFFDPSSIEVELNPNVFPEDEIEWMQVDAISGVRKTVPYKGNDPWRLAIGLDALAEKRKDCRELNTHEYGKEINDYVFNFVGAGDFDGKTIDGLQYQQVFNLGKTGVSIDCKASNILYPEEFRTFTLEPEMNVFGAGNADYIIEPGFTCWRDGTLNMWLGKGTIQWWRDIPARTYYGTDPTICVLSQSVRLPPLEINVTVTVKMKSVDQPFILNRIYLPEINIVGFYDHGNRLPQKVKNNIKNLIDNIYAKKNLSPKTAGHTQTYDFQAARINKCFQLLATVSADPPSQSLSTFAAENKRWATWYSDQYTHVITTEGADAYTAEYNAEKSCMILHKLGKVVPKGMSVVIVADANVESVVMNRDDNAAAPQNIPNNSLNGANIVFPVANIISTLKGRVDGAQGGTVYVLRQGDNGFGYYPYTDTNMTAHTSFLFIADVQYPGGTQPAFVSVAFE